MLIMMKTTKINHKAKVFESSPSPLETVAKNNSEVSSEFEEMGEMT